MDELLHHCLRELAFDGDLGCNVSRLTDFITDFYSHSSSTQQQTVDDAFCAFIWSLIVQQPSIRVGITPPGITSEVWIAPQTSARRKANANGEEHAMIAPPALELVSDAKSRPLPELQDEYGDKLRIASDRDTIYSAITGTHIRFPKLSPMVYSALQIITRGREKGVTVVQLGQQSKYDQKTCFYLVKQLTELNLVVKVRRGGVGTHFVIHRYFFERSSSWNEIREEELRAEEALKNSERATELLDDEELEDVESLNFTPIDSRHLSSLPLVRARVVKLLKASTNSMHVSHNMLVTIGFSNPTKTDRRFFQSRIRELVQQGVIEKVIVPSTKKKASKGCTVLCLRLVDENATLVDANGSNSLARRDGGDDDEDDELALGGGVKMNLTIHKQINDLLEEAGTAGMTLTELAVALCQFDRRTIELLLTRADKYPPPAHLGDLGIAALMETSGRERRHRYFTVSAYRTLIDREGLDKSTAGYGDVDLENTGGFLSVNSDAFYQNEKALHEFQDSFKDEEDSKSGKTRKKPQKNPVLPDGTIKQGRPRKKLHDDGGNITASYTKTPQSNKRKSEEDHDSDTLESNRRPKKKRRVKDSGNPDTSTTEPSIPKKRGRTKKVVEDVDSPPKKRGRPPKTSPGNEVECNIPPKKRGHFAAVAAKDVKEDAENIQPVLRRSARRRTVSSSVVEEPVEEQAESGADGVEVDHQTNQDFDPPQHSLAKLPSEIDTTAAVEAEVEDAVGPSGEGPPEVDSHSDTELAEAVETVEMSQSTPAPVSDSAEERMTLSVDHISALAGSREQASEAPLSSPPKDRPDSEACLPQKPNSVISGLAKEVTSSEQSPSSRRVNVPSSKVPAQPRARVNVSNLRRENELIRVVETLGGIVNIQTKELYDAHLQLLEMLAQAGEPASSPPGTKTDKRTVTATFNSLESRGKIKQLTTSVPSYLGSSRSTVIVYLPTVDDQRLNAFLIDLGRTAPPTVPSPFGRRIEETLEYGSKSGKIVKSALPLQLLQMEKPGVDPAERWSKNAARAEQLFSYEDAVIRDVLLTERSTLGQAYGTIVAKALRARELHMIALDAFNSGHPSSQIVSHEKKIFNLSFLLHDLPLGLYCKLVPPLAHSSELTDFMSNERGLSTVIRDLPPDLVKTLQIGRSRARTRLLDTLEVLRTLGIVVPLEPSTTTTPLVTCQTKGTHPTSFDEASREGWTVHTPLIAPGYWMFNDVAPLHHWAKSEIDPPFLKDISIASLPSATSYWSNLQQVCLNLDFAVDAQEYSRTTNGVHHSANVSRSLRRRVSWNSDYVLTWHQTQYLERFHDIASGKTPLDSENSGTQIQKISWVISAPPDVVQEYYQSVKTKIAKELQKARRKSKQAVAERMTKEAKASLMKKAEEARQQRELEWNQLLERVQQEPLKESASLRVKNIQARFLQSTTVQNSQKWEQEIAEAIRETEIISRNVLTTKAHTRIFSAKKPTQVPNSTAAPPLAANPPEKSVASLIAEQGPPIVQRQYSKKQKKKNVEGEDKSSPRAPVRRHRFLWNRDYEELARDASAIIRARCREAIRLDWGAFEQVFPAVPRNSVRQRVAHLREVPGSEAYLNRLEDRWYELWVQHRGTPHLPDDDPTSPSNFDLAKHIEFLRKHIDKNALRVGYVHPQQSHEVTISSSIDSLLEEFDVEENNSSAPSWDFVWNATVEEGREKKLLSQPFVTRLDEFPSEDVVSEEICVAESALKMVLGTPNEDYDADSATSLLHSVGEESVTSATKNLLGRGVLSKLVRDPQKFRPGRLLKISELNQNALNGNVGQDTFQDAAALEDLLAEQEGVWREWPLLATDGDLATLTQMVSDDKVEFQVDTSHPQSCRPALDWNSKKADDDQIETSINVRFHDITHTGQSEIGNMLIPLATDEEDTASAHGTTIHGLPACCRRNVYQGIIDCSACLDGLWEIRCKALTQSELDIAQLVHWLASQAGPKGLTKQDLLVNTKLPMNELTPVLSKMTREPFPSLYCLGYNSLYLVSPAHARPWTVTISEDPVTRVFPRRWLDIFGSKVMNVWKAGLRAVLGVIVFRAGVSQIELQWRLKSVYDRQEVLELLRMLQLEGFIRNRCPTHISLSGRVDTVLELDDEEAKHVYWFLDDCKRWYQV